MSNHSASSIKELSSIKILPARLANQIAAGEVVERPASVLKELLENSIDAGATQIEIDIEKGGHKKIKVTDNGSGIPKEELMLALSRHATSKVSELDDLENIQTLGFRGEALASVSSVSRLTLTSRTQQQSEAWQARCEGREMQVLVEPAAHPVGSSVEVLDLFFNTPARRKFLRTEKTEFNHIEELFNRIALSRYDVGLKLKHNGKVLKNLPAIAQSDDALKRVKQLCGASICNGMLSIEGQYQGFRLHGWLSGPGHFRAMNDVQFVFVNNRMMRDKLIFHAIRQSYEGLLPEDKFPFFVLYLDVPCNEVDVNVHPAKHEVRFHQSRLVHDFIFSVMNDALGSAMHSTANEQALSEHHSSEHLSEAQPPSGQVIDNSTRNTNVNSRETTLQKPEDNPHGRRASEQQVDIEEAIQQSIIQQEKDQSAIHHDRTYQNFPQSGTFPNQVTHQYQPKTDYIRPLQPVSQARDNSMTPPSAQYIAEAASNYSNLMTPAEEDGVNRKQSQSRDCQDVLAVDNDGLLLKWHDDYYFVSATDLVKCKLQDKKGDQISQPLLLPVAMPVELSIFNEKVIGEASNLGMVLQWTGKKLILKQVPAHSREQNWQKILSDIIESMPSTGSASLLDILAENWALTGEQNCMSVWQSMSVQQRDMVMTNWARKVPLQSWLKSCD